ncbi:MAG TPA: CRISPR-associated endonuclease Cas2 [Nitrospirae bacterium]|nr:CRISPR-associated endonuclease Cas2 [bacterium BMS3Abin06]HDH12669.1 CRISPR-associated endonuclease Cas2 [Nitrospirota bacterium]HDY99977.1 CRISPR-associated endonuclease Cas2 [Nitrospirota bacterium]
MKTDYLVCYDITKPRRLARVYRFMKSRGIHLQYSVFHCTLTWPQLRELKEQLSWLIDEEKDDVRIYPLPSDYKVIVMGCGDRVPDGVEIFLE